jgi:PAS domain S-box-containing protein
LIICFVKDLKDCNLDNKLLSKKQTTPHCMALSPDISVLMQRVEKLEREVHMLREINNKLNSVVDNTPASVVITDYNGLIEYVNPAFTEVTGYSEDEAIGMHTRVFKSGLHPAKYYEEMWKALKAGNVWCGEFYNKKKNGEHYWEDQHIAPVVSDNGEIKNFVAIKIDITLQKLNEEKLRSNVEILRQLAHNLPVAISYSSLKGEVLYINKTFTQIFGYSLSDVQTVNDWFSKAYPNESYREKYKVIWEKDIAAFNTSGIPIAREYIITCKDLTEKTIELSFSIQDDYLYVVFVDLTERKKAENILKADEVRLESLMRLSEVQPTSLHDYLDIALEEAIKLLDSKIGYIYFYNEKSEEFTLNTWSKSAMAECEIREKKTLYNLKETGIWGEVVRQRKPIMVNNFQQPSELKKGYPEGHVVIQNFISIPVFSDGEIVAVIGLANKESGYSDTDLIQLNLFAQSLWITVSKKRAEEELYTSKQMLQLILDNIPQRVFWKDKNSVFLGANMQFAKDAGLSDQSALIGKSDFDMIWRTNAEKYRADDNSVIQSGKSKLNFEEEQNWATGESLWLRTSKVPLTDINGEVFGVLGTYEDITEVKQAENALKERTEELNRFFNVALDLLCIASMDGYFIQLNKSWESTLGYSEEELKSKSFLEFVHPDDLEGTLKAISTLSESKPVVGLVNRYKCKDGSYKWIEWRSAPANNLIYAAARDITDRKMYEQQLKELNATKDKFFSIIAHDLKNPFNAMLAMSNLLFEKPDEFNKSQIIEFGKLMNETTRSAFDLLDNLLQWSQSQTGHIDFYPQNYLLKDVVSQSIKVVDLQAINKQVTLEIRVDDSIVIFADLNIIKTVLRNLISNGVKYTNAGGTVIVYANKIDGGVEVVVKDTGVGIAPEAIAKIFRIDSKYTTLGTAKEAGTGLGLVLCKEFIGMHNGKIWVESVKGEGSEFKFFLPGKL